MDLEEFERLVAEAVGLLPQKIRQKLDNVAITVEEGESPNNSLFGLYHGVSLLQRGPGYGIGGALPDKITIYKGTIERFALRQAQDLPTPRPVRQAYGGQVANIVEPQARDLSADEWLHESEDIQLLVRRVVWHEIGHHFGFGESEIRKLEQKWLAEGKI